jgi:hypothetical protein
MVVALPIALANTTPLPYVREKDGKRDKWIICYASNIQEQRFA